MVRISKAVGSRVAAGASTGKLYIVGTPIGNLEDITFRALHTLREVDAIACEDTRRTQRLLNHCGIKTPTISYHEQNEMTRAPELVIQLEQGSHIALISDAGMPVISDPGYRLVNLAIRHSVPVVPVPGASAFVAALAAAGLPVDKFRFLGFLPSKKLARRRALEELKGFTKTLVFYEAPHRVLDMLEDISQMLGDPPVVVAREVTKIHEEFLRGSASEVLARMRKARVRGEITVLVGAPPARGEQPSPIESIREEMERVMEEQGLEQRAALKVVARRRGISRSQAYRQWQFEKSVEG
jgi:16S rRNA (cytidine1402-2'-O)-methyltransferase